MPRIRNWKDLVFFRPDKETKYQHVDALFTEVIDWKLIETHWRDLMQVTLSISDCWRSKRNAQSLSLPLIHESRTLFLSLSSLESQVLRRPNPECDPIQKENF
jgi:TnpA family transposase